MLSGLTVYKMSFDFTSFHAPTVLAMNITSGEETKVICLRSVDSERLRTSILEFGLVLFIYLT